MLEKTDSEVADDIMEFLSSEWPDAFSVDEIADELNRDREKIRQTCIKLHNRTMSEDGVSQDSGFKYRFSPGDDSLYEYQLEDSG